MFVRLCAVACRAVAGWVPGLSRTLHTAPSKPWPPVRGVGTSHEVTESTQGIEGTRGRNPLLCRWSLPRSRSLSPLRVLPAAAPSAGRELPCSHHRRGGSSEASSGHLAQAEPGPRLLPVARPPGFFTTEPGRLGATRYPGHPRVSTSPREGQPAQSSGHTRAPAASLGRTRADGRSFPPCHPCCHRPFWPCPPPFGVVLSCVLTLQLEGPL